MSSTPDTHDAPEPTSAAEPSVPPVRGEPSTGSAAAAPVSAPEPDAPSQSPSGEAAADASDADGQDAEDASDELPSVAGETSPGAVAAGDPTKKKRRRRRRGKKRAGELAGAPAEGDAAQASVPEGADASRVGAARDAEGRRDHLQPFSRHFGGGPRRHAFSVGELVAGRALRVEAGAIAVDLFGKATAFMDVGDARTPEELPTGAEPVAEEPEHDDGSFPLAELSVDGAEAGELPAVRVIPSVTISDAPLAGPAPEVQAPPPAPLPADLAPHGEVDEDVGALAEAAAEEDPGVESPSAALAEPDVPPPTIGEILRGRIVAVSESGHIAIWNRVVDRSAVKARIAAALVEKRRVLGLVYGYNRGGFDVLVEGVRAFCPASGMSLAPVDDPASLLGARLEFLVAQAKGGQRGLVITRRSILEREARKAAKHRLKELVAGQRLSGRVTEVREYGILVDLGGIEGLVHQSEVSWLREERPADVAKPGDAIDVVVLGVQAPEGRRRSGRVSLSRRAALPDPWDSHGDLLEEGSARKGKVVRTTDFGAFVQLTPGIEGLLHITELGRDLKHASQVLSDGEELDVVIERVDRKARRISLSKLSDAEAAAIAAGTLDPSKRPRSLRPGTYVPVVVSRVEHHGISVQVQGVLGRRGRGYISNRDVGAKGEGGDRRRTFAPGATLEVKIVGTDRDGGLRCSLKAREVDEERQAVQAYRREASKQGFGTFGDLLRAKLAGQGSAGSDGKP